MSALTDHPTSPAASIIVSYNGKHDLPTCLRSIESGPGQSCEVIAVENASADGSAYHVAQARPRVHRVCNEANPGFGGGAYLRSGVAQGECLVFLNPHTLITPGWLKPLLDPLADDPTIGMTAAKIVLADEPDCINACGKDLHISGLTLRRGMGQPAADFNEPAAVSTVSGAALAIRKDVFERVGGFDESPFLYKERPTSRCGCGSPDTGSASHPIRWFFTATGCASAPTRSFYRSGSAMSFYSGAITGSLCLRISLLSSLPKW